MKKAYLAMSFNGCFKCKIKFIQDIVQWFERKRNIRRASKIALELWKMKYNTFCPHLNSGIFYGKRPEGVFMNAGLQEVALSDVLILGPNWQKSKGANIEREAALECTIKIFEWEWHRDQIKKFASEDLHRKV